MGDEKQWGVWNVTRKEWLLAPAMTELEAREAANKWNGRAQFDNRFEARKESL